MTATAAERLSELRKRSESEGFDCVGVASVDPDLRREYFLKWLAEGQHGDMRWMERDPERRLDAHQVLPQARSVLVFGLNYYQPEPERRGRIAKYALGADYHKVMLKKLKRICLWLQELGGINKPYVDTGPLLEKRFAVDAGLGWQGKNTMLLNNGQGQWLFLGCILTTLDFPQTGAQTDRCGTCTRCIDVCPTGAITAPYQLDARRCISYLTIEHKGAIPEEWRIAIGDHLYGCDDCLDVCPWNRFAAESREQKFAARDYPDLRDMLFWEEETFLETMAGSPIRRIGLERWLRNICVVLGNIGGPADLQALKAFVETRSPTPMVREHADWAMHLIRERTK